MKTKLLAALLLSSVGLSAQAATYTVGPAGSGKQYTQLSAVFTSNNLAPGDIVEVDGNATYNSVVVQADDAGTEANPVIIRWNKAAGGTRPVLSGGAHTIKFQQSNHVVLDGFDIRGGSTTCVFNEANTTTVRNSVIHDCPGHGILAADQLSGSFTLEYSEVYNAGASSNRHPLYIQSDEVAFPNAVFRMQYNYIHNGTGGNLVKARHQRSEIYYNWLEGATYQAIELIGPDCYEQQAGWTTDLKREDADIVGNVIIQSGTWPNAIRMGGDLNGRSQGRVRLVNNTILFPRAGAANAVMVQLGAESLEMHNNVIYQTGGSPVILKENVVDDTPEPCSPQSTSPWSYGRKVAGSYNWVQTGATQVPGEWSSTLRGTDPSLTNIATRLLRPSAGSPLLSAGTNSPTTPVAFPFPSPLLLPQFDPPLKVRQEKGDEHARLAMGNYSIGALEQFDIDDEIDPVCTRTAPMVSLTGNTSGVSPGTAIVYTATVRNQDTAECEATAFNLAGNVPSGWSSTLPVSSLSIAPGASATATWTVASSGSAASGSYPLTLSTSSAQSAHTASGSISYLVNAAPVCTRVAPVLTLSGSATGLAAGTAFTYTATLRNQDTAGCAATAFSLAATVPSGWGSSLPVSSLTVAPGNSATASWTVASPSSVATGTYPVSLRASSSQSVHNVSAASTYAAVAAPVCTRAAPTLTLSGNATGLAAGTAFTYTATLRNQDTAGCAATAFSLAGTVPSSWGSSLPVSSLSVAPGGSATASWTVASPSSVATGTYPVSLRASSSQSVHNVSVSSTYGAVAAPVCQRKSPVVSLTGPDDRVVAGTSVVYQAKITNRDTAQCSTTSFSLASSAPSGWSKTLSASSVNLAPGANKTVSLTIRSPLSAPEGSYNIGVGTASGNSGLHTQSASATYRIKRGRVTGGPSRPRVVPAGTYVPQGQSIPSKQSVSKQVVFPATRATVSPAN